MQSSHDQSNQGFESGEGITKGSFSFPKVSSFAKNTVCEGCHRGGDIRTSFLDFDIIVLDRLHIRLKIYLPQFCNKLYKCCYY